jgi:hypothetical protein
MGKDEAALTHLWQEKRGEVEPYDLSGNLIVQLGVVTEHLNTYFKIIETRNQQKCVGATLGLQSGRVSLAKVPGPFQNVLNGGSGQC